MIRAARQTRDEAFEKMYRAEYERSVRTARSIVGNDDQARDVAAEAFVRAWARWPALRDQRPGAWVAKVTHNLAIDAVRRRVATHTYGLSTHSPEEPVLARCLIENALEVLSRQQRIAIVLHYIEDRSEDEIAALLGTTKGSVKVHLHRGRLKLRGCIGPPPL